VTDSDPDLRKKIDDIHEALCGDVKGKQPGLHARVGILERSHGNVVKLLWIVITVVVGSGFAAVKSFFAPGGTNPHP
jgi:hypothetical protein